MYSFALVYHLIFCIDSSHDTIEEIFKNDYRVRESKRKVHCFARVHDWRRLCFHRNLFTYLLKNIAMLREYIHWQPNWFYSSSFLFHPSQNVNVKVRLISVTRLTSNYSMNVEIYGEGKTCLLKKVLYVVLYSVGLARGDQGSHASSLAQRFL